MKTICGRLFFWLTWPLIWIYAPLQLRPRMLLVCDDTFLAVKPYFGSGAWQLPGGGMQRGESELSAAVRELAEETGVHVDEATVRALLPAGRYIEKGLHMHYCIFYAHISKKVDLTLQKNEIGEAAWLPLTRTPNRYVAHVQSSLKKLAAIL